MKIGTRTQCKINNTHAACPVARINSIWSSKWKNQKPIKASGFHPHAVAQNVGLTEVTERNASLMNVPIVTTGFASYV